MAVGTIGKIHLEIDRKDFGRYLLRHGKDQVSLSMAFRKRFGMDGDKYLIGPML